MTTVISSSSACAVSAAGARRACTDGDSAAAGAAALLAACISNGPIVGACCFCRVYLAYHAVPCATEAARMHGAALLAAHRGMITRSPWQHKRACYAGFLSAAKLTSTAGRPAALPARGSISNS